MSESVRAARRTFASVFLLAAATMVAAGFAQAGTLGAGFPSTSLHSQTNAVLLDGANPLIERSGLITGARSVVMPISVSGAGTITVQLADPGWPTRLQDLSFAGMTSSSVLARMQAPGSMSFEVNGPMTFFAAVYGSAAAPLSLGLYSLQVSFAPVPAPAALLLMLSGLVAFRLAARERRTAAPA